MKKVLLTTFLFCTLYSADHNQQFNLACKAVEKEDFDTADGLHESSLLYRLSCYTI